MELSNYKIRILRGALREGGLPRGRFGWPMGSIIRANEIRTLINSGYVEFFYDWGYDRPVIKTTALGRSRYQEGRSI